MKFLLVWLVSLPFALHAQSDSVKLTTDIQTFQNELNKEYKNKTTSPLKSSELRKFKRHDFFPINLDFVVEAQLMLTPDSRFMPMEATGNMVQEYRTFAIAHFQFNGQPCALHVYQSKNLMNNPEYKDYLFLPFTDLTSGNETYGGGRYIGLRIPTEGHTITINFNLAYNPYCAYNEKYSCPLVPKENELPVAIRAGVKLESK